MEYIKSPIHYMGNKYALLSYIIKQFPLKEEVSVFYDAFGGSGTVSLNVPYDNIIYNELNGNMVNLFTMIKEENPQDIINHIKKRIEEFDLNKEGVNIRQNCEAAKENRKKYSENYFNFRNFYNKNQKKDIKDLYTLSFYSFCNLIRFNSKNEFNMPFGNGSFCEKNLKELILAHNKFLEKNIEIKQGDVFELLKNITKNENQLIYLDPPYQNSTAIYNECKYEWSEEDDERLFNELDRLSNLGIKWAYSNVLSIKGKNNNHIEEWANKNKYTIIEFNDKKYSSLGKGNANAREVMIINYEQKEKQYSIFDYLN